MPVQKYRGKIHDIKFPCYAGLKMDGELEYLIVKNGKAVCSNKPRYGRIRQDFPVTEQAKKLPSGIYIGELYWNEGRTIKDFHAFLSHKADDNLKLKIWSVLAFKNEEEIATDRNYQILEEIRNELGNSPISIVDYWKIQDEKQLMDLKDKILAEGWEGLVLRNRGVIYQDGQSINWIKIKRQGRDVEAKAQEEVAGLSALRDRIVYLLGRKLTRQEDQKITTLNRDKFVRLDDFKVSLRENTISCFVIAKIK